MDTKQKIAVFLTVLLLLLFLFFLVKFTKVIPAPEYAPAKGKVIRPTPIINVTCREGDVYTYTCPDCTTIILYRCINGQWVRTNETCPGEVVRPIGKLKTKVVDKYTKNKVNSLSVGNLYVEFYDVGANIRDPMVKPLAQIDVSSGSGEISNPAVFTNTPYDVYFSGDNLYYDEKLDYIISYSEDTGIGYLTEKNKDYIDVTKFGTIEAVGYSYLFWSWSETGTSVTCTIDKSLSCKWRIKIGEGSGSSAELWDLVMCLATTLSPSEVSSLTARYIEGTSDLSLPTDLTKYLEDAYNSGGECIKIADLVKPGQKATWEFTLTLSDSISGTRIIDFHFDDVGDYKGLQYPSRSSKAQSSSVKVTIVQE